MAKKKAASALASGYVEYSSNNSGGHWWLKDEDWKALEKAGWEVDWYKESPKKGKKSLFDYPDGRFLGALASHATRRGLGLRAAADEFESVTGACATDAGCSCCGPPHHFSEYDAEGNYLRSGPETHYTADW